MTGTPGRRFQAGLAKWFWSQKPLATTANPTRLANIV
jgi:hypothetical protein